MGPLVGVHFRYWAARVEIENGLRSGNSAQVVFLLFYFSFSDFILYFSYCSFQIPILNRV